MSDFEDRLNSILGDPAQMERITAMARSLMGTQEPLQAAEAAEPKKDAGLLESLDPAMLGRLTTALSGAGRRDEKHALLEAMKPYLSPARREKLDRAVKLAKMIGMAELAFGALGGDHAQI